MKYTTLIFEHEGEIEQFSQQEYEALVSQHRTLQQDAKEENTYVSALQLKPVNHAMSVRIRDGKTTVTDGPFIEAKELFIGFYIFDCSNLDVALKWAGMIPPGPNGGVEIRPIDDESCNHSGSYRFSESTLQNGSAMYCFLNYQSETLLDAYSNEEIQKLIQGNVDMMETAMATQSYITGVKLMPTVTATSVQHTDEKQTIIDGPYTETKEVLLGLHVIACQSVDEAIGYAESIPNAKIGTVEIRPVQYYEQVIEPAFQWNYST